MQILAIIPARKNSKRLLKKNRRILCGKPIIEYTINEAKKSKYISNIVITTDDEVIYNLCRYHNVIGDRRPSELCKDDALTQEIVNYIITLYPEYDAYVVLQPTSPLRKTEHIDKCIKTFMTGLYDSVMTVTKVRHSHLYIPNGAVYVFRNQILTDNMAFILMKEEESIDVDTELDFKMAEMILNG